MWKLQYLTAGRPLRSSAGARQERWLVGQAFLGLAVPGDLDGDRTPVQGAVFCLVDEPVAPAQDAPCRDGVYQGGQQLRGLSVRQTDSPVAVAASAARSSVGRVTWEPLALTLIGRPSRGCLSPTCLR